MKKFMPVLICFTLIMILSSPEGGLSAKIVDSSGHAPNLFLTPPIPLWHEEYSGGSSMPLTAGYVMTDGDGISLKGGMFSFGGGGGISKYIGMNFGFGMLFEKGDAAPYLYDVTVWSIPFQLCLTAQLVRVKYLSLMMFGGGNLGFGGVSAERVVMSGNTYGGSEDKTDNSDFSDGNGFGGYIGGIQGSLKVAGVALTPFFMMQHEYPISGQKGNNIVGDSNTEDSDSTQNVNIAVSSLVNKYYGLRLTIIPAQLALNAMVQSVPANGEVPSYKTTFFYMTYYIGQSESDYVPPAPKERLNPDDYRSL